MFHVEHKSFPHSYNLRGKIFEVFNFRMKYSNFLLILFYRYSIIKMCNGIILEPSQDWKIAALTKCAVCTFFYLLHVENYIFTNFCSQKYRNYSKLYINSV